MAIRRFAPAAALLLACEREPAAATPPGPEAVELAEALLIRTADTPGVLETTELDALGEDRRGKSVKVHAFVTPGSIERRGGTDEYRFAIARRGASVSVTYTGALPADFAEQREVVVTGTLADDGRSIAAGEVIAKCPTDYEEMKRAVPPS